MSETDKTILLKKVPGFLKETLGLKNVEFEVVSWIPVFHQGWELDPWAIIVRISSGETYLITTDHGAMKKVENPRQFLKEYENQYQAAAQKCAETQKYFKT